MQKGLSFWSNDKFWHSLEDKGIILDLKFKGEVI